MQKLGNADFLKRAPEEVVEGENEKRDEAAGAQGQDRRGTGAAAGRGLKSRAPILRSIQAPFVSVENSVDIIVALGRFRWRCFG